MSIDRKGLLAHLAAHPIEGSVAQKRAAFAARLMAPVGGTPYEVGGIDGLRFGDGPIRSLWFHGGGYVVGSPETHVAPVRRFAQSAGLGVFVPRYRLAPDHVWPAPLNDAVSVLDTLDGPIVLAGDSAGGHLALNLARLRPGRIAAMALFSPNTDRTGTSDTRLPNTPLDPMNSDAGDRDMFRMAMPNTASETLEASPLLANLSKAPPIYLCASEGEVLLDDTRLLAAALTAAGVHVQCDIASYAEAGLHMFQNWPHILPAGQRVLDRAAQFVASQI